jgi:glycosyltransferase involved in cell wall biosynthesis
MQIIMVTNNALEDKIGGLERYVSELSGTLARRGHEVTIIAKRWSGEQPARERRADGVLIERHPVPSKGNPFYAALYPAYVATGVARRARGLTLGTVVHAHMGVPALALALRRQPYVLTFHAPVWRELLSERQGSYLLPRAMRAPAVSTLRRAERLVARRAASAVVLSEFMRSELSLLDHATGRRARVIPGGIDPTRFRRSPASDRAQRHPPLHPVLFTARRLTPRTGVDALIGAMPAITEAFPATTLRIAGSGAMKEQLRGLAHNLRVADAVQFLGQLSDEQLAESYRAATLVVLPTRELEGFGLTTAEALACGAVVIGTPAGATPELLAPLDAGLIASDVSPDAIAAAVLRLLSDPARLEQIRRRAAARVIPEMTWDRVADAYLEVYEELT